MRRIYLAPITIFSLWLDKIVAQAALKLYEATKQQQLTFPAPPKFATFNQISTEDLKNHVGIEEEVKFNYDGNQDSGNIVKLKANIATIRVAAHGGLWRVTYHYFSKFIYSCNSNYIVGELVS